MRHPLQRISTKYALFFAALLSALTLLALALSGYFVYSSTNSLRAELADSFSSVQSTNDIRALHASGAYLSNRLFNPLYRMDISGLNEEVEQIRAWLDPVSIRILDQSGRVVTDGTGDNQAYGRQESVPSRLEPYAPVIENIAGGQLMYLAIGYGDEIPGFARIELSDERNRTLVEALQNKVQKAWQDFENGFLPIILSSIALIAALSVILGGRLSVSLSRPLSAMTRAADEYAAGNLGYKLPEWSEDELGGLARSLNKMSGDLQRTGLLLTRAQEMAALGSWEWRRHEAELTLSHGVYRILGVAPDTFRPTVHNLLEFVAEKDQERLFSILQGRFEKPVTAEFNIRRSDGEPRTLFLKGEPESDRSGALSGFLGTMQDVTEQRRSQEQLVFLANYDDLTHLPNRNLFYDRLRHSAKKARRRKHEVALLFFDLDRFKAINDALGHDVGDELLRHVARRLKSIVRDCDTLARMGGDEFTLIIEDISEELAPQKVAQNIIDVLSPAFLIDGRELFVSASIGITLYPKDATNIDTLIKNADTAMYVAKEQGRATFRFFTPELNHRAQQRLSLEHQLRQAIDRREFELHYQPQVRCNGGKLVAMEALLRWRRQNELQPPGDFLPILEDTGLIARITGWALREACSAAARMRDRGLRNVRVAVNLSACQFQQSDLLVLIDEALAEHSLRPEQLELEITESTLLDRDLSRSNAAQLAARGVRLAIDDFGTGYSSLTYLKRFHVDTLKIDRSFIKNMLDDPEDAQIASTVVTLARGLGIECIAEGVEEEQQLVRLREFGCDQIQGFLVSRPIDIDQLIQWAESQNMLDTGCYWSEIA